MKILKFLQQVDRRFLYVIVLFVVGLPFFMKIKLPVKVSPGTQKMYDKIESMHESDALWLERKNSEMQFLSHYVL